MLPRDRIARVLRGRVDHEVRDLSDVRHRWDDLVVLRSAEHGRELLAQVMVIEVGLPQLVASRVRCIPSVVDVRVHANRLTILVDPIG